MAGGRIKGITIEIGGDTKGLQDSLKKVDKDLKGTQNKLKDINKHRRAPERAEGSPESGRQGH